MKSLMASNGIEIPWNGLGEEVLLLLLPVVGGMLLLHRTLLKFTTAVHSESQNRSEFNSG